MVLSVFISGRPRGLQQVNKLFSFNKLLMLYESKRMLMNSGIIILSIFSDIECDEAWKIE